MAMTNSIRILLISIALFALGAANPASLLAAKGGGGLITIIGISPNYAVQGDVGVPVKLTGSGFGPHAKVVFLEKETGIVGDIAVRDVVFDEPNEALNFMIDVGIYAKTTDYEVEVTVAGRKGKGTTFKVEAKVTGNMQFETCNDVFFPRNDPDPYPYQLGPCRSSVDGGECQFLLGNPTRIKRMMTDCTTTETLVLPDGVLLTSASAQESGTDRKTLIATDRAEDPWSGGAVITNAGHRAQVGNINIEIDTSAANGCDGPLMSAVSFVLHNLEGTSNPYPNLATQSPYLPNYNDRASYFDVDGVYVSTGTLGGPLCTAVELIRHATYTDAYGDTNDWKARVTNSKIESGTYVDTAIWLEGFKQQQDINPPTVSGNTIFAPDCAFGDLAFGIVHGPLIARDNAVPQSEALLENNTIIMSEGGCETTGILLLGGTGTETVANINSNYIGGATYGVVIDGTDGADSANLKGNTLTGESGLVGICSNIPFSEKGKPNQISGLFSKRTGVTGDDCPPWTE
jgi:hypothetical protein